MNKTFSISFVSLILITALIALNTTLITETPFSIKPSNMASQTSVLRKSNMFQTVELYVNTYGGDVGELLKVMHSIKECDATVITIAEGYCFSAGSILALCGDKLKINDDSLFMFHYAVNGKGKKSESPVAVHANKVITDKIFKHVLYKSEIKAMENGESIWISGKDLKKRAKFQNYLTKTGKELL